MYLMIEITRNVDMSAGVGSSCRTVLNKCYKLQSSVSNVSIDFIKDITKFLWFFTIIFICAECRDIE